MTQIKSFAYRATGTAQVFNQVNYKLLPDGVYDGLAVGKINDGLVSISDGTVYITDPLNDLGTKITISGIDNQTVTTTNVYIILRFTWLNSETNPMQVLSVPKVNIQAGDIILAKCIFSGTTLLGTFDVSERKESTILKAKKTFDKLQLTATDPATLVVNISSGDYIIDNVNYFYAGGTVTLPTVTSGMISYIVLNAAGVASAINSSDIGSPINPTIPNSTYIIGRVLRIGTISSVRGDHITLLHKEPTAYSTSYADSIYVHLTGNETIAGAKTFSSLLTATNGFTVSAGDTQLNSVFTKGSVEINSLGTGDRSSYVGFHSSGLPNVLDYSSRIMRNATVNGTFVITNTGTGAIHLDATSGTTIDQGGLTITLGGVISTAGINRFAGNTCVGLNSYEPSDVFVVTKATGDVKAAVVSGTMYGWAGWASSSGTNFIAGTFSNHGYAIHTNNTNRITIDNSGLTTFSAHLFVNSTNNLFFGQTSVLGLAPTYTGDIRILRACSSVAQAGGLEFNTNTFGSGYGSRIISYDDHLVLQCRNNSVTWKTSLDLTPVEVSIPTGITLILSATSSATNGAIWIA
jgi:hypothetical protein